MTDSAGHSLVMGLPRLSGTRIWASEVCQIGVAAIPVDEKMFLVRSILNPIIAHVHGLAFTLFDCVGHDALAYFVVGDDGGWGLLVAEEF